MITRILYVYKYSTFGGVERTILNRARLLKKHSMPFKIDVYYFKDGGAKKSFIDYIDENHLNDYIEVVSKMDFDMYNYIVSFDTLEILKYTEIDHKKLFLELHTDYEELIRDNEQHFNSFDKVIVSSLAFKEKLNKMNIQVSDYLQDFVLENDNDEILTNLPNWNQKIVLYFGRIDAEKNIKELINGFRNSNNKDSLLLLVGPLNYNYLSLDSINSLDISNKIVYLPPFSYDNIEKLLNTLEKKQVIFVSPSKCESFGLSTAEAIMHQMPVVLSDIFAHKYLVDKNEDCLYPLGDEKALGEKIDLVFDNYKKYQKNIKKYRNNFSEKDFIKKWKELFKKM